LFLLAEGALFSLTLMNSFPQPLKIAAQVRPVVRGFQQGILGGFASWNKPTHAARRLGHALGHAYFRILPVSFLILN
jgi:hypothetical protein